MKRILCLLLTLVMVMGLFGCKAKYRLEFDDKGLKSPKTSYAEGETVTFYYDMVATDTDYSFFTDSPDVSLHQEFDGKHSYVFTFTMPAHNVKITVKSQNSMQAQKPMEGTMQTAGKPESYISDINLVFYYYEATVGTPSGDRWIKLAVYKYNGDEFLITLQTMEEGKESGEQFRFVPSTVPDKCAKIVNQYKMDKWKNGHGLKGKEYEVRFWRNGEIIKVGSNDMPDKGKEAYDALFEILSTAWSNGREPDAE